MSQYLMNRPGYTGGCLVVDLHPKLTHLRII
jgi:hypothetical protein